MVFYKLIFASPFEGKGNNSLALVVQLCGSIWKEKWRNESIFFKSLVNENGIIGVPVHIQENALLFLLDYGNNLRLSVFI